MCIIFVSFWLCRKFQKLTFCTFIGGDTVRQWSPQRQKSAQVMDLSTANIPGSISFKITSMTCAQQVLFAGGFQGECTWKSLDSDSPIQYLSNANTASGITNYTDIIQDRKGVVLGIVSNNDASIKYINLTTAQIQTTWTLPFAVNVGSPSLVFFSYMLIISF